MGVAPCRRCRKPRPKRAVFYQDPFCSRECATRTYGTWTDPTASTTFLPKWMAPRRSAVWGRHVR